jgi:glycosyltransferase involved in cell wall biosynthesis
VIKNGDTGLLVPEKDAVALAMAVLRVLNDPAEAGRLGARGYAYASEFFDWERITDELERFYFTALGLTLTRAEAAPLNENMPAGRHVGV